MDTTFLTQLNDLFSILEDSNATQYNQTQCVSKVDHYKFYQFAIIPSVLISLAFSVLKQRRRKLTDVLHGRPALVHPMDALTSSASISYIAAFGATIFLVYEVIFRQQFAFRYEGPLALKTLIVIVSMIWYGFVYYPIFATLSVRSIFSYGLGSLYVWVITAVFFYKAFECDVRWQARMVVIARDIPNLVCLTYLSISLPVRFILAFKTKTFFVSEETDLDVPQTLRYIKNSYQGLHVRKLFRKPDPKLPPPEALKDKIKLALLSAIHGLLYKNEPGFRYSTRIQSVLMVGAFLLYIVTFEMLSSFVTFFDVWINTFNTFLDMNNLHPTGHEEFHLDDIKTWIIAAYYLITYGKVCFIVSMVVALVMGLVMILHMFSSYRTNLLALYRGDHSHIPDRKERSNASLMVGCMRFAGYQVGYIAWGFVIQFTIIFLLSLAIALIVILVRGGISDWLVNKVLQVWPLFVWTIVLNILQIILAKFLFLQKKGDTLSIDNRRFFFIFTYFMFFFNIFLGLVSCLLRIIKAIVLGALFLSRLDHSTLSHRFQFFDPGFAAYVGYMHVENEHTHPVMIVFIRLMLMNLHFRRLGRITSVDLNGSIRDKKGRKASVQGIKLDFKSDETDSENSQEIRRKKYKANFNWLLFYTLINNPQIRIYRKGYIQNMMKAVKEGIKIPVSDLPIADLSQLKSTNQNDEDREDEVSVNGVCGVEEEIASANYFALRPTLNKQNHSVGNRRAESEMNEHMV